jgi:hypothetical protein
MKWLVVGATVFLVGLGSAVAQPPPPPNYAPVPPPQAEVVPPAPGPRVIWEPGHWRWDGVRYVWIGGRYVERRPHYGHYVEGHWRWSPHQGRYVWVAAHWE